MSHVLWAMSRELWIARVGETFRVKSLQSLLIAHCQVRGEASLYLGARTAQRGSSRNRVGSHFLMAGSRLQAILSTKRRDLSRPQVGACRGERTRKIALAPGYSGRGGSGRTGILPVFSKYMLESCATAFGQGVYAVAQGKLRVRTLNWTRPGSSYGY